MNLHHLFADSDGRSVRYALSGAAGGFARTLLAQTRLIPRLSPVALCDLDIGRLRTMCRQLGYPEADLADCADAAAVARAAEAGHIALVADPALLGTARWDILVEATGNPAQGFRMAREAIAAGRHVAMVSKEVDSVAGPRLAALAAARDVVYTTADGDQPANLIGLITWAETLGLDIVAAGKSSEYDLVFDPDRSTVSMLDTTIDAPALAGLLTLGDDPRTTLAARAAAVAALPTGATADYCEMAVVANSTGHLPDTELLHYPVARPAELADVYALREHGGLLHRPGAVDVFRALRLPGEASFAGGVFVVVRTHDPETWETLRGKGHVVSRDGRYAAIYLPYHLMGVETPVTLLSAVLQHRPSGGTEPRLRAVLAGRARHALAAGTELSMGGHHHDLAGVQAVLLRGEDAPADAAPLYLAAGSRLTRDVPAGGLITFADIEGYDSELADAWYAGAAGDADSCGTGGKARV
ncbi:homoserine dehydrogenase [Streptomyces sp. NEAU-YJ-81]|uniref:homoserine dehydrogenase n=1 Tax=Streptomyces sp. NEAU-YJ-81 TaxID=2820288 RepID=UPI001ABC2065|nr:homoserine dehydrogenase [Streptomyces sp. NEAU-YJ-81]MBO3677222.1 homoserine dehydrogenase [Streptomyces sp. NEAU-YJ-81]